MLLGACGRGELETPPAEIFIAPTLASTPLPTIPPTSTQSPPTPTPPCVNLLVFVDDLTIPDGTTVQPGSELDKRWLVQNAGSCNWDQRYRVQLIAGSAMGAPESQALYPARSGTEATLRILFTAPVEPGLYRSAWQAHDVQGQPFGDPFFIEIVIEE